MIHNDKNEIRFCINFFVSDIDNFIKSLKDKKIDINQILYNNNFSYYNILFVNII